MICFEHLHLKYSPAAHDVLQDIHFSLPDTHSMAIVGTNRSGKTTLAYAIAGIFGNHFPHAVSSGKRNVSHRGTILPGSSIGFVFQDSSLNFSGATATCYEEISFALRYLGLPQEEIDRRCFLVMEQLGIQQLSSHDPRTLSTGETTLVALASEIAKKPQLIILDEIEEHLNRANRERVWSVIRSLHDHSQIVMAAEALTMNASAADAILVLEEGHQLFFGSFPELLESPVLDQLILPPWLEVQRRLGNTIYHQKYRDALKWTLQRQ
jgi:energy-coupling factor transport system ATP-binding protein